MRIQVTTDELIYFYLIDKETCRPKLENVMFNFMNCSQMMFGSKVRFSVTFKQSEPNFNIWTRKYYHNFKVNKSKDNLEGAVGLNLDMQQYCIGHGGILRIVKNEDHEVSQSIMLPKYKDDREILYMTKTIDELRVGICLGHKLRKESIQITNIIVFNRKSIHQPFNLEKDREFTNQKCCITFAFNKKNHEELLFATQTSVFAWNYMQEGRRDRTIQRLT